MTYDALEQNSLDTVKVENFDNLKKLSANFKMDKPSVDGKFMQTNPEIQASIAGWLGKELPNYNRIENSLFSSAKEMYYGAEREGIHTLGLKEIGNWNTSKEFYEQNIKQQAGYAAEVISTTKENLIAKHDGSGTRVYRADDLPNEYRRNDPYVDKVRRFADGTEQKIQTKFVGKDPAACLSKLASKNYEKYLKDGEIDKIEIPKDYYEKIRSDKLIESRIDKLNKQLEIVKAKGKTDAAENIQSRIDKYKKINEMLEPSTVTMEDARYARLHPKRYTAKLFATDVVKTGNSAGVKAGLGAATLTASVSTIDNVQKYMAGQISATDAFIDVAKDTGTAGAIGYGSAFVSTAVASAMSASSHQLIKSLGNVGNGCIPAAVISFGIDSYDSISDYAQGQIDEKELAYDLGESAANVAGGIAGAALAGAAIGSVVPGAGTAVGFVAGAVGGMVGCAVASEAYKTVVDLAPETVDVLSDEAKILADKAESCAKDVVDLVAENVPEAVNDVKCAINDFAKSVDLPFNL